MIGLIDCNNFYVSCERVFNPTLINKPVIVLSNNDGCAIARSNEVKQLGIKMGTPLYQIKHLVKQYDITVLSANFSLYGDMSHRVMQSIIDRVPEASIYSIDEAFIDVSGIPNIDEFIINLQSTITQNTGIPVSIGVARTKVLAKLANHLSKKLGHAYCLPVADENALLKNTQVSQLWGVGKNINQSLLSYGIDNAYQLKMSNADFIRKKFTITLSKLQEELKGKNTITLDDIHTPKKQIIVSRSFGRTVTEFDSLRQAIIKFIYSGAEKLRQQGSEANSLTVAIYTNPHSRTNQQYYQRVQINLPRATASSSELCHYAMKALQAVYKKGYHYKRAGIMLLNITPAQQHQADIFHAEPNYQLDNVLDTINKKYGKDMIKPAVNTAKKLPWHMKQHHMSYAYTTNWRELLKVN